MTGTTSGLTTVEHVIGAPPSEVFAVLADGWTYPLWVVGATHMRSVDPQWPSVGAKLHHSLGAWPLMLEDDTEVLELVPDRSLVLSARAWPFGAARVELTLEPEAGGTRVRMAEGAIAGPARLMPRPLESVLLTWRNRETLARLEAVVQGRMGTGKG
ncbi:Polyketide cyclase / dehydrase and lipid transport [Pseudonocardia thermophila]|jgi:Polyketide cyclase / dehydrase and lipid transport.|uniref:Polyketide cyclase / dehydrase and lipid transport n=1 Tax=Pseudonocardia thermophila TaxID=1848 RepID=A0A1M6XXK4_PSETH|nr:SRPBCC family protein [Pseudonocardia thermophila]SHL10599.1 Polyketide cyclase / dehydrase and lipid transport [Pseudonocardia thermophila]